MNKYDTAELTYAERGIVEMLMKDVGKYAMLAKYIQAIRAGEHLKKRRAGRRTVEIPPAMLEELLKGAA